MSFFSAFAPAVPMPNGSTLEATESTALAAAHLISNSKTQHGQPHWPPKLYPNFETLGETKPCANWAAYQTTLAAADGAAVATTHAPTDDAAHKTAYEATGEPPEWTTLGTADKTAFCTTDYIAYSHEANAKTNAW